MSPPLLQSSDWNLYHSLPWFPSLQIQNELHHQLSWLRVCRWKIMENFSLNNTWSNVLKSINQSISPLSVSVYTYTHICIYMYACISIYIYPNNLLILFLWRTLPNKDGLPEGMPNRQIFLYFLSLPQATLSSFLALEFFQYQEPLIPFFTFRLNTLNIFSTISVIIIRSYPQGSVMRPN